MKALIVQLGISKIAAVTATSAAIVCGVGSTMSASAHFGGTGKNHSATHEQRNPHPTPPPVCPTSAPTPSGTGNIVVTVPRLVEVQLGADGHPIAARTNTGQRPCAGDTFLFEINGQRVPSGPEDEVVTRARPGVWKIWQWYDLTNRNGAGGNDDNGNGPKNNDQDNQGNGGQQSGTHQNEGHQNSQGDDKQTKNDRDKNGQKTKNR